MKSVSARTELFTVRTPADALRALLDALPPRTPEVEELATYEALDRVLADDLAAPADLPAFPRSTMDGYALRSSDSFGATEGLPAYLDVVGEVVMGRAPALELAAGQAARIATGGMVPPGADAVVMVEQTQEVGEAGIEVVRPVAPGENVVQVGEDIQAGGVVLERGSVLRPQDLGGLMALGITRVRVARRLRVGIVSGGDEVVEPDESPGPGRIRDVNSYTLSALVQRAGHEPVRLGIVPDEYEALLSAAEETLPRCDVLIFSAGSSVSLRDMTARVVARLGEPGVLVHGVSLRPGKPTILAVCRGKPVFGLPGNPVSCMVTFDLFVSPTLARMSGAATPPRRVVLARLERNVASATGREDYVQVRLERGDGLPLAVPVFGKSNLIYTLVRADGMLVVPLDRGGFAAGETVEVVLF